jgi:hypothetical protein
MLKDIPSRDGIEDARKTKTFFNRYLFIEKVNCLFSFQGIVLSLFSFDSEYDEGNQSIPD